MPTPVPPVVARRNCGGCSACCTVLNIPEVNSPAFQPCSHLCVQGCGIYDSRPGVCRDYYCEWALGNAPEWMKPDLCGVVPGHTNGNTAMHLREVWPGASRSSEVRRFIRAANARGVHVVVTLHPEPRPGGGLDEARNQVHFSNGEVREFTGSEITFTMLRVVPGSPGAPA